MGKYTADDNRSMQLNPNNERYYSSRDYDCDDDGGDGYGWQALYKPLGFGGRRFEPTKEQLEASRRNEERIEKMKIDSLVEQEHREELDLASKKIEDIKNQINVIDVCLGNLTPYGVYNHCKDWLEKDDKVIKKYFGFNSWKAFMESMAEPLIESYKDRQKKLNEIDWDVKLLNLPIVSEKEHRKIVLGLSQEPPGSYGYRDEETGDLIFHPYEEDRGIVLNAEKVKKLEKMQSELLSVDEKWKKHYVLCRTSLNSLPRSLCRWLTSWRCLGKKERSLEAATELRVGYWDSLNSDNTERKYDKVYEEMKKDYPMLKESLESATLEMKNLRERLAAEMKIKIEAENSKGLKQ